MDAFLLWHEHESQAGEEGTKLIGVYSSQLLAEQAKERLTSQPGFRDAPKGFIIDRYEIDEDHWTEGYVIVRHEDIVRQWEMMNE